MSEEDIADPRAVPRWVEAGVSGVPRSREWDVVAALELPELEDSHLDELEVTALPDGRLLGAPEIGQTVLDRLTVAVEVAVRPPYALRALRQGRREWSAAARELSFEAVVLAGLEDDELAVAVTPDGERTLLAGGEEPQRLPQALEAAFAELEQRGRQRFGAFVARAERLDGDLWAVTVDPL